MDETISILQNLVWNIEKREYFQTYEARNALIPQPVKDITRLTRAITLMTIFTNSINEILAN